MATAEPEARGLTMLYPIYIDSTRSAANGRILPKEKCPSQPNGAVMAECCQRLGVPPVFESRRRHPRDPFVYGRIRVKLFSDLGDKKTAIYPRFPNKRKLLAAICEIYSSVEGELIAADPKLVDIIAQMRSEVPKDLKDIIEASAKNNPMAGGLFGGGPSGVESMGSSSGSIEDIDSSPPSTPTSGRVVPSKKKNKKKK